MRRINWPEVIKVIFILAAIVFGFAMCQRCAEEDMAQRDATRRAAYEEAYQEGYEDAMNSLTVNELFDRVWDYRNEFAEYWYNREHESSSFRPVE